MSLIKICGLRREIDIAYANELKPDFIGFIFAESFRRVSIYQASVLRSLLDPPIKSVGVFVNADLSEIQELCQRGIIDMIQLHGDEDGKYVDCLKAMVSQPIIKTIRIGAGVNNRSSGAQKADFLMFDAFHEMLRGGGGSSFDWSLIGSVNKPFFLAGGLNQDNIAEAIRQVHPYAVDVSSGVETDGYKDFHKMSSLINKVRIISGNRWL